MRIWRNVPVRIALCVLDIYMETDGRTMNNVKRYADKMKEIHNKRKRVKVGMFQEADKVSIIGT